MNSVAIFDLDMAPPQVKKRERERERDTAVKIKRRYTVDLFSFCLLLAILESDPPSRTHTVFYLLASFLLFESWKDKGGVSIRSPFC